MARRPVGSAARTRRRRGPRARCAPRSAGARLRQGIGGASGSWPRLVTTRGMGDSSAGAQHAEALGVRDAKRLAVVRAPATHEGLDLLDRELALVLSQRGELLVEGGRYVDPRVRLLRCDEIDSGYGPGLHPIVEQVGENQAVARRGEDRG